GHDREGHRPGARGLRQLRLGVPAFAPPGAPADDHHRDHAQPAARHGAGRVCLADRAALPLDGRTAPGEQRASHRGAGPGHALGAPRRSRRLSGGRHRLKYDLAAFDFDGTLADTLPWFESILDSVADKYGFRKADAAERARLRHHSAHDILKILGIPMWKMPAIMTHVRQLMREVDPSVQLFDGMAEALTQVRASGLRLAVVSSNSAANVRRVLGPQAAEWFDDFECGTDMFGKAAKLKR